MRSRFEEQLSMLYHEMIEMGALCEEIISLVSAALKGENTLMAAQTAMLDKEIDQKERDIESLCMKLLLRQQPVAGDLRQISAALKMITDMERIGDQAEDIAEMVPFLTGCANEGNSVVIEMASAVMKMVTDSVDAYVKRDVEAAQAVIRCDDIVDDCFLKVKNQLITLIAADSADGEYALDLLMTAKYFERIGDHAVNLAEWVIYAVTGVHKSEEENE